MLVQVEQWTTLGGAIYNEGSGEPDMLDRGIKHKLWERWGALRTVECLQGHRVQWHRLCTVQVQAAPFTETTVEPSIFKTCFSASLILPKALAAWLVILKWRLKQRRERECFLVLLQVAKHCQQIQGLSGLRFSFFFFFAIYNIMDGPGAY